MAAVIKWMLNLLSLINPWTMFRPRTRKTWCALPGNLGQPFSIDCVEDQDSIYTLKEKIRETTPYKGRLFFYRPMTQLKSAEKFKIEDGEKLHPRRVITSDPLFPESKDPGVDVVVVVDGYATLQRPKPQRLSGENYLIPHLITLRISRLSLIYVAPIDDQAICPRTQTVSTLAATVDQAKIVHVRGTAASGKTYLSELLRDYYQAKGTKVFLLTDWTNLSRVNPWGSLAELVESWDADPDTLSPEFKEEKGPGLGSNFKRRDPCG